MEVNLSYPDFLCIGAQKAGTTWLHAMLRQHEDVYLGPLKEYQFFNTLFNPLHKRWTRGHARKGIANQIRKYVKESDGLDQEYIKFLADLYQEDSLLTLPWYQKIFSYKDGVGKCKGDITPEYCTIGKNGIEYIANNIGAPKIIYMVRDPYLRALSHFRMNISRGVFKSLDEQSLMKEVENPNLKDRGDYKKYIPEWESHFGKEAMLYIPFGDVASNPTGTMRLVESHLGITKKTYKGADEIVHSGKKINIPESVRKKIKDSVREQEAFLLDHFGKNFVSRI